MSIERVAEDYFSKLNPMASRMYVDMNETKLAYEDLWATLPEEDQKEILSESIIKPEVLMKYRPNVISNSIKEYAVKIIIDDHCSYRDEHSAPFSFQSKSQRDLTLFENTNTKRPEKTAAQPKPMLKVNNPKISSLYVSEEVDTFPLIKSTSSNNTLPKTGLDFLDNW